MSFLGRVWNLAKGALRTFGSGTEERLRDAALDEELGRTPASPVPRSAVRRPDATSPGAAPPTGDGDRPAPADPGTAAEGPRGPERDADGTVKRTL
jgi:hypothetical protein